MRRISSHITYRERTKSKRKLTCFVCTGSIEVGDYKKTKGKLHLCLKCDSEFHEGSYNRLKDIPRCINSEQEIPEQEAGNDA